MYLVGWSSHGYQDRQNCVAGLPVLYRAAMRSYSHHAPSLLVMRSHWECVVAVRADPSLGRLVGWTSLLCGWRAGAAALRVRVLLLLWPCSHGEADNKAIHCMCRHVLLVHQSSSFAALAMPAMLSFRLSCLGPRHHVGDWLLPSTHTPQQNDNAITWNTAVDQSCKVRVQGSEMC